MVVPEHQRIPLPKNWIRSAEVLPYMGKAIAMSLISLFLIQDSHDVIVMTYFHIVTAL